MKNTTLVGVLACNILLTTLSYLLIRLNHLLSQVLILLVWIVFCFLIFVVKIGWGVISMLHRDSKFCIDQFMRFGVIEKVGTIRERKLYLRTVRAMRPMAIPVGFEDYTFYTGWIRRRTLGTESPTFHTLFDNFANGSSSWTIHTFSRNFPINIWTPA